MKCFGVYTMLINRLKTRLLLSIVSVGLCFSSSAIVADSSRYRVSNATYYDNSVHASNIKVGKRYHRGKRSRGNNALGYLVGGVIIGSILSNRYSDSQSNVRQYEQPSNEYWVDKYGDCFRLEQRNHGKVYVQTYRDECY